MAILSGIHCIIDELNWIRAERNKAVKEGDLVKVEMLDKHHKGVCEMLRRG